MLLGLEHIDQQVSQPLPLHSGYESVLIAFEFGSYGKSDALFHPSRLQRR
jgi:hypothetical protein